MSLQPGSVSLEHKYHMHVVAAYRNLVVWDAAVVYVIKLRVIYLLDNRDSYGSANIYN